jgi:hypothetical protein
VFIIANRTTSAHDSLIYEISASMTMCSILQGMTYEFVFISQVVTGI